MDLQFNFLGSSLQLIAYYSQKFYCHLFWSASNDGVDTADRNSAALEMMPIVNLFNEWHSSSTSKKIRAVFLANAKAGNYMGSFAPYGYVRSDTPNHTLVIDPEAAEIVRRMSRLTAMYLPLHRGIFTSTTNCSMSR